MLLIINYIILKNFKTYLKRPPPSIPASSNPSELMKFILIFLNQSSDAKLNFVRK